MKKIEMKYMNVVYLLKRDFVSFGTVAIINKMQIEAGNDISTWKI